MLNHLGFQKMEVPLITDDIEDERVAPIFGQCHTHEASHTLDNRPNDRLFRDVLRLRELPETTRIERS